VATRSGIFRVVRRSAGRSNAEGAPCRSEGVATRRDTFFRIARRSASDMSGRLTPFRFTVWLSSIPDTQSSRYLYQPMSSRSDLALSIRGIPSVRSGPAAPARANRGATTPIRAGEVPLGPPARRARAGHVSHQPSVRHARPLRSPRRQSTTGPPGGGRRAERSEVSSLPASLGDVNPVLALRDLIDAR
jgi:hypothetical protein